jgi:hypothetical protein
MLYLTRLTKKLPNCIIGVHKEFISKALLLKNLPLPLFAKEGFIPSLWSASGGEARRDFVIDVFYL